MKTSDLIETKDLFSLSEAKRGKKFPTHPFGDIGDYSPGAEKQADTQAANLAQVDPAAQPVQATPDPAAQPAPTQATGAPTANTAATTSAKQKKPGMLSGIGNWWSSRGQAASMKQATRVNQQVVDAVANQWNQVAAGIDSTDINEYHTTMGNFFKEKWGDGANNHASALNQKIDQIVATVQPKNIKSIPTAISQIINTSRVNQVNARATQQPGQQATPSAPAAPATPTYSVGGNKIDPNDPAMHTLAQAIQQQQGQINHIEQDVNDLKTHMPVAESRDFGSIIWKTKR
jgi:hypothetical protein